MSLTIFQRVALHRVRQIDKATVFQYGEGLPKYSQLKRARTTFVNNRHVSAGERFTGFHHMPRNLKGSTPRSVPVKPRFKRSEFMRVVTSFAAQVIPDPTQAVGGCYYWVRDCQVEAVAPTSVSVVKHTTKAEKTSLTLSIAAVAWKPVPQVPSWATNDKPKLQTKAQADALVRAARK